MNNGSQGMKQTIVVIGSSNIDFIMKMERLPRPGETVGNAQFMQTFGGKGANQAVGAARAGGQVWLVNCIGDDPLSNLQKENLRLAGIHTDYVFEQSGAASGAALIMIDKSGENVISVAPGANYLLSAQMVNELKPLVSEAGIILLQYEIHPETLYAALDLAADCHAPVMFNLAPANPFNPAYLSKVTFLVVNEREAAWLCGFPVDTESHVREAARALHQKGVQTVIITLGAKGAYALSADGELSIPAFQVTPVDTTAAGDVFCGALAVGLVEGKTLAEAIRFASAASAISVTRLGAQPSAPARQEIDQFLSRHLPNDVPPLPGP